MAMKIIHYRKADARKFDSDAAKSVTGRVLIGAAYGAKNFCMRVFELEAGGFTPRHAHAWEHEIFIHAGSGEVFSAGSWTKIVSGDAIFIPGNEEHQIRNVGTEPLVFVCLIPAGAPEL